LRAADRRNAARKGAAHVVLEHCDRGVQLGRHGVHFSLKVQREANESQRAGDDPANSRGPQAGRRPAYEADINIDARKSGAARLADFEASGFR
jgi:hypothetical protein